MACILIIILTNSDSVEIVAEKTDESIKEPAALIMPFKIDQVQKTEK